MRSEAMEATSDTAVEAEGAELMNTESSNEETEGIGPPFASIGTRAGEVCAFDCDCSWGRGRRGRGSDSEAEAATGAEGVGCEHCAAGRVGI